MAEPLALRILQALQHAKDAEVDYLAFRLGASKEEIEDRLQELVGRGIVRKRDGKFSLEAQTKDHKAPA
jgi:DNA-binding Lrp family transcriptional regulator